jgi:hypothetical protein
MIDFSTTRILEAVKRNERKNRRRNLVILTIAVLLGLIFLFTSVFHIHQDHEELRSEVATKDSLAVANVILNQELSREDSIKDVVIQYLSFEATGSFDTSRGLLADTLLRYYQHGKTALATILEEENLRKRRLENVRFRYDPNFAISQQDSGFTTVIIIGKSYQNGGRGREIIKQIQLDSLCQICYVRDFDQ